MSFAPYPNMNEAPLLGNFNEKDCGNLFEYSENESKFFRNFPHRIFTIDGFRFARVLETVAYIVVDEDENGEPVVEKWFIKNHRHYNPVKINQV